MPTPDQWEIVAALGTVIIFAGTVALNFQAIRGFFRRPRRPAPAPEPSPDATALVEATLELVSATQSMAEQAGTTSPEAEALSCTPTIRSGERTTRPTAGAASAASNRWASAG